MPATFQFSSAAGSTGPLRRNVALCPPRSTAWPISATRSRLNRPSGGGRALGRHTHLIRFNAERTRQRCAKGDRQRQGSTRLIPASGLELKDVSVDLVPELQSFFACKGAERAFALWSATEERFMR